MILIVLGGCGGSSNRSSSLAQATGLGGITLSFTWGSGNASTAPASVVTIYVAISGGGIAAIQQSVPVGNSGVTINNIPAGSGYTVTSSALDAAGNLLYQATANNITVAAGQTTEIGTVGMLTASLTLISAAITPQTQTIAAGTTFQYTITGTYSDGTTRDLTTAVTWGSLNTAIATINASGKVVAFAAGTTSITAVLSGINISPATITVTPANNSVANVMKITVNGSLCSSGSYVNKPCVSVTVCSPGTSNCQTITDILLDTGSAGLRILSQALAIPLTQISAGAGELAECIQFGDGSSEWGPVQMADVVLGGEPVVQVPIHVVNQGFGTAPLSCTSPNSIPDTSPSEAGFNGILGVGLFAQDCGSDCVTSTNVGQYYSCSGTTCSGTAVPLVKQVQNPVAALPVDNNGVIVQLPSVPLGGAASVDGSLIIGVGTQTNNQTTSVTAYPADPTYGEFTTVFNGKTFTDAGYIDSGTNSLSFDVSSRLIAHCNGSYSGYFCPSATSLFTATNSGYRGTPSGSVPFEIGNAVSLLNSSNNVFSELGDYVQGGFGWGLPFFFGKKVFIGIEGMSSDLAYGPYWAY